MSAEWMQTACHAETTLDSVSERKRKSFSCHLFFFSPLLFTMKAIVRSPIPAFLRCKSGPEVFLHLIAQLRCDISDRRVVDFAVKVTGIWRHVISGVFWLSCAWCLTPKPLDSPCTPLGNEIGWDSRHPQIECWWENRCWRGGPGSRPLFYLNRSVY